MQKGLESYGFESGISQAALTGVWVFFSVMRTMQTSRGPQGSEDFGSQILLRFQK